MTERFQDSTARLAAAFGLILSRADAEKEESIDTKTARELSVLSRILEKRLVDMRGTFAQAVAPTAERHATAKLR